MKPRTASPTRSAYEDVQSMRERPTFIDRDGDDDPVPPVTSVEQAVESIGAFERPERGKDESPAPPQHVEKFRVRCFTSVKNNKLIINKNRQVVQRTRRRKT